jgi:hypothetical protein
MKRHEDESKLLRTSKWQMKCNEPQPSINQMRWSFNETEEVNHGKT